VDSSGLVRYREVKGRIALLDSFLARAARLEEEEYRRWSREDKIAFWINIYNARTLRVVAGHYPFRPGGGIRDIPGVWDRMRFPVMGRSLTLNEVEHGILRKEFQEPRVHMALVCAARSCPPLRAEPYRGKSLEAQLDDQVRRFLARPSNFSIDRQAGRVYLSRIFEWYGGDFCRQGDGPKEAVRCVLSFLARYLEPRDRRYLERSGLEVLFSPYHWSLNEE